MARYTLDNTEPSCVLGKIYLEPILITNSLTFKAVNCDEAGNQSEVLSAVFFIDKEEPEENQTDFVEEIIQNSEEEIKTTTKLAKTGISVIWIILASIFVVRFGIGRGDRT